MLTMDKAVDQFGYEMCCAKELNNNYFSDAKDDNPIGATECAHATDVGVHYAQVSTKSNIIVNKK